MTLFIWVFGLARAWPGPGDMLAEPTEEIPVWVRGLHIGSLNRGAFTSEAIQPEIPPPVGEARGSS